MFRKTVCGIMLSLLLIGIFSLAVNIKPVKSTWTGTVYIRADGRIDPPDAPIITHDNITYTLTDNIKSSGDGIVVERDNVIIDGAGYTIQGVEKRGSGIYLLGRSGVTIRNITITNFFFGIYLYSSSNNNLTGNNIIVNDVSLKLDWSSNNIVSSNNIIGGWIGVDIDTSQSNIVCSNVIANYWKGIYVYLSPYNNISTNLIMANEYGIDLYSSFYRSDYNNIYSNNILNNTCGIYLRSASDNHIFHNNFINNVDQALVFYVEDYPYPSNVWDDSYPSGGNYWSDYAGVDQFSGPYQNITGADNIGDIPYEIPILDITRKIIGVDRDHYPLMNPYTPTPPKPPIVNATVDVNPKTLNLRSRGRWITAYIELPKGYNVQDINISTIMLNETIPVEPKPIAIGDYDNDSISDLMVKFNRQSVISHILSNIDLEQLLRKRFMTVTLTVKGYLNDGTPFEGSDTIKIIMPMPRFIPRIWKFMEKLEIFPI